MHVCMYLKLIVQLLYVLYTPIAVYSIGYSDQQAATMVTMITSDSFVLLSQTEQLKNNQLLIAEAIN